MLGPRGAAAARVAFTPLLEALGSSQGPRSLWDFMLFSPASISLFSLG